MIPVLLAACAGPLSGTGAAAPGTPAGDGTATSEPAVGGTGEAGGDAAKPFEVAVFAAPSGVICDIAAGGTAGRPGDAAECFVPEPAYPGWELSDQGLSEVTCPAGLRVDLVIDSEYWLGCAESTTMTGPVLEPGAVTHAGGFTCSVETDAITCTYLRHDLAFRVGNHSFDVTVD
jgi:hypothetical protein